jgi:hypothetical protein
MLSDDQLEELHTQAWRDFITNEVEYLRAIEGRDPIRFSVVASKDKRYAYIGKLKIGRQTFRVTATQPGAPPWITKGLNETLDFIIYPEPKDGKTTRI